MFRVERESTRRTRALSRGRLRCRERVPRGRLALSIRVWTIETGAGPPGRVRLPGDTSACLSNWLAVGTAEATCLHAEATCPHAEASRPHAKATRPHADVTCPDAKGACPGSEVTCPPSNAICPPLQTLTPYRCLRSRCYLCLRPFRAAPSTERGHRCADELRRSPTDDHPVCLRRAPLPGLEPLAAR